MTAAATRAPMARFVLLLRTLCLLVTRTVAKLTGSGVYRQGPRAT
jgi:hypothetical protein